MRLNGKVFWDSGANADNVKERWGENASIAPYGTVATDYTDGKDITLGEGGLITGAGGKSRYAVDKADEGMANQVAFRPSSIADGPDVPFVQPEDHTGATQTYDINSLDFTVNGYAHLDAPPTLEQLRIRAKWDNFETGAAIYMAGSMAAPFVGAGLILGGIAVAPAVGAGLTATGNFIGTAAPIAGRYLWSGLKFYHRTFGMKGGYLSMGGEVVGQTYTQIASGEGVSLGNYNAVGIISSAFVKNRMGALGQAILSQNVNVKLDGTVDGAWNHSLGYNVKSNINAIIGSQAGPPIFINSATGVIQGCLDKEERMNSGH